VAPGTSSVLLFDAKVSSDATFDVTNYSLTATSPAVFTSGVAAASFSRLVLNVDGIETDLLTVTNPASVTLSSSSDKFRVEAGKLVSVKVTGTLKSNAAAAAYRFTVALTQAKNVSNGNTVTLTSSQAGDTVTVSNGKATFKAATNNVGVLASKKLTANASNTEIGRFAILAEAEDVTVRKLVLTNSTSAGVVPAVSPAIVDLTNLISGNGVKLVDLETGADISATVTVAAGTITVDSMSLLVLKDTTKNIKVVANTTSLTSIPSGQTNFTLHINAPIAGDVTRQSTGNADLVGAVIAASNTTGEFVAASSTYVAGKALPVVSLTKIGTDLTRYMVTITNVDPESNLLADRITLKATPGLLNGTTAVTWDGMVCVRNGATGDCGVSGTSTAAANIASAAGSEFTLAGTIPNLDLVKNNGTVSFEIYAPNLPFFSAGGLTLSLKNLKYDGSVTGEDYTGMAGASVTANK
jgi:hypothetical protein